MKSIISIIFVLILTLTLMHAAFADNVIYRECLDNTLYYGSGRVQYNNDYSRPERVYYGTSNGVVTSNYNQKTRVYYGTSDGVVNSNYYSKEKLSYGTSVGVRNSAYNSKQKYYYGSGVAPRNPAYESDIKLAYGSGKAQVRTDWTAEQELYYGRTYVEPRDDYPSTQELYYGETDGQVRNNWPSTQELYYGMSDENRAGSADAQWVTDGYGSGASSASSGLSGSTWVQCKGWGCYGDHDYYNNYYGWNSYSGSYIEAHYTPVDIRNADRPNYYYKVNYKRVYTN